VEIRDRILVIKRDITTLIVDVIVNAANPSLLGGGGVDGAIHLAGGPDILAECRAIRAKQRCCETGQAVITTAGLLPAKFVVHTVGPIWYDGNRKERELLASCYHQSLLLAVQHGARSIAFPGISTGVYCFPKEEAVPIAFDTVISFLEKDNQLAQVIFVCYDDESEMLYKNWWKTI
jgi:O-acetyl-ADP-ribose deacetylase